MNYSIKWEPNIINFYKLRIGDYRCLIDIDFENKILKVQVLDHRSNVYKKKH